MLGIEHLGFWYKGRFIIQEEYDKLTVESKPIIEKFIKDFLKSDKGKQDEWKFHWAYLSEIPNLVVLSINNYVTVRLDPDFTSDDYRMNVETVLNMIIEKKIIMS